MKVAVLMLVVSNVLTLVLLARAIHKWRSCTIWNDHLRFWFFRLEDHVNDHANFRDGKGKSEEPYESTEVAAHWDYFHTIQSKFRESP